MNKDEPDDKGNVTMIAHIHIRDPDTGETILKKRDKNVNNSHERKNKGDLQ